jgi:leucyl aminopeptidase
VSLPLIDRSPAAVPLHAIAAREWAGWLRRQPAATRTWLQASGTTGRAGQLALVPKSDGKPALAVMVLADKPSLWDYGALSTRLPPGDYRLATDPKPVSPTDVAVAFALGAWRFERYRKPGRKLARLVWPAGADKKQASSIAAAIWTARDLITTPAADMGPAELADAARTVARRHKAKVSVIVGDDLLRRNYPMVHAVGRASVRAPRLIDIVWGSPRAPKVTLVGKGVCFDSGGLDLKSAQGMQMMKKDMGGAANVLALAAMIMGAGLKVRLRVLVPAVENFVSANAFRPLDVIRTRKGITVEIGNTDAEGRLILCDALAEAASEKPALLIDCATLTGAARVAVGPDLPAMFCNDDRLAEQALKYGTREADPMWRMPLWRGYRRLIDSRVADVSSTGSSGFGGAITAALFLQEFVPNDVPWIHLDMMAWNSSGQPGRPEGGEVQGMRALYAMIAEKYAA